MTISVMNYTNKFCEIYGSSIINNDEFFSNIVVRKTNSLLLSIEKDINELKLRKDHITVKEIDFMVHILTKLSFISRINLIKAMNDIKRKDFKFSKEIRNSKYIIDYTLKNIVKILIESENDIDLYNRAIFLNNDIIDSLNVDDKNRVGFRFLKNNGISIVKKHDIDALYKLDLNKIYELNDKILGFCSTFYVAINKLYSSLYEFKFDEIPNSFGFDLQCFLAKYPNFEENDIKIVNLSRFKKISLSHYQKTLDEYLREIHLPKILRSIWPCVVDKNNNLIYFPRFQENYQIRHDIFNIDIKNFLTTFNEEILD